MHHVWGFAGFTKQFKQRIVLNIDAHVREPKQLLNAFVHESIHMLMPLGDELNRKPKWAMFDKALTTTHTGHGEQFGAEYRRINPLLGYKLMTDRDCSYGIAGRKWAYDNVTVKCRDVDYVDECGMATAILSNGSPDMLESAVRGAVMADCFDRVLSIEEIGVFKPDPRAYRLAVDRLAVPATRICFVSSNGWDIAGAAHFGFRTVWINRAGEPRERLPSGPEIELTDLRSLPQLVGRAA